MEVKFKERLSREREGAVRVHSSVVSSNKDGIEYETDQRYAEVIVRHLNLKE